CRPTRPVRTRQADSDTGLRERVPKECAITAAAASPAGPRTSRTGAASSGCRERESGSGGASDAPPLTFFLPPFAVAPAASPGTVTAAAWPVLFGRSRRGVLGARDQLFRLGGRAVLVLGAELQADPSALLGSLL